MERVVTEPTKWRVYTTADVIIDFHTHVFPPDIRDQREEFLRKDRTLSDLYSRRSARMVTAEELISAMDESEVDVSVVLGIGWSDSDLGKKANDYVIESVNKHPTRLRGFCSVNPLWGDEAVVREIERCSKAGLLGIGELHPDTQGFDLGDLATMSSMVETAVHLDMPILTHTSEPVGHIYPGKGHTTPDVLWRFLQNFPDAEIILAHWGGGLPFYALMPEVLDTFRRAYFDTAASTLLYRAEIFEIVTSLVGSDKILLGSDYPVIGQGGVIQQLLGSSIADEAKNDISSYNAAKILGIY